MKDIRVVKGRTNVLPVSFGYDISGETFASEIRRSATRSSELIATWTCTFLNTGEDGELLLTLDDEITTEINDRFGYMDIKRISDGEPFSVFTETIQVEFIDSITA